MEKESLARSLREHSMCKGLLESHVDFLAGCAKNVRVAAGKFLFREGKAADELYLVRSGRLALEMQNGGRGTLVLETIGADDALGWAVLHPPHLWTADARALEPTLCFAIDGVCLRRKLDADHSFGYAFTRRLLAEVHERLERARLQALDVYKGQA